VPLGQVVNVHDHRRRPIKAKDRQTRIAGKPPAELFPYYGATGQVGLIDGFLFDFPAVLLGEDGAPFLDRQRAKAYAVDGRYWVNNHAHILAPKRSTIAPWLLYALNFIDYEPHVGGTTRLKLTKANLERIPVPLAPLAEQRRIVARVDALFAEIAEGEAALAEARKGLDAFRRALLKAAVTGELTRKWRAENLVTETGHGLLARIAKIAEEDSGRVPHKSRRHVSNHTSPIDAAALPRLPNGWAWATIKDVGTVQLGRQRAPQHHAGEHMRPYLRVANVFEGRIDFTDVKEMNFTPDEFKTYELKPGDILLNEGQTPDLLGRPAMWRGEFEGYCFQNTLLRFQVRSPMNAEFCLLVFRHYLHAKRFKQESQITTNIAHLSSGRFGVIEFPVPPLEEQIEIARLVTEGLASASDTLTMLDAEVADTARLKQSILKAAFEGRLVSQDPADEPAPALLARIAANLPAIDAKRGRARKSNA
jgi:type I restriction enzyme S subunit